MKHFTQPPEVTEFRSLDIPAFMQKRNRYTAPTVPIFSLEYVLKLIGWAELEYSDMVNYFISKGNPNVVRHLQTNHSACDVIAITSQFKSLLENIDSATWNTYPEKLQLFLIEVKQNYDARNSKG